MEFPGIMPCVAIVCTNEKPGIFYTVDAGMIEQIKAKLPIYLAKYAENLAYSTQ